MAAGELAVNWQPTSARLHGVGGRFRELAPPTLNVHNAGKREPPYQVVFFNVFNSTDRGKILNCLQGLHALRDHIVANSGVKFFD